MAFPTLSAQQETNRKILEDLQIKKQLLQKGVSPVLPSAISGISPVPGPSPVPQMNQPQLIPSPSTEFSQISAIRGAPFNLTNAPTFGFFVPQDSFYGNSFLPVLPRLEPLPGTPQK
ncbi:SOSS complex subunit C homolog [Episyrphus balteatus]|uniref:SOSS complex subunit C homolog n=1 Tax=Episyrphus balteatus TaxID=286459 RepID=UPI0024865DCB|nr:SOSS complex subunit C homolog [Episyrphus balteatus]